MIGSCIPVEQAPEQPNDRNQSLCDHERLYEFTAFLCRSASGGIGCQVIASPNAHP
jgi:hypothetical protein